MVRDTLSSSGQPLDVSTRAFMEPRFGYDFSHVRVHTDSRAAESAKAVQALAYCSGRDIVFGAGQYAPATGSGRRRLAHELVHVVQQAAGHVDGRVASGGIRVSDPGDRFEREADGVGSDVTAGQPDGLNGTTWRPAQRPWLGPRPPATTGIVLQRDTGDGGKRGSHTRASAIFRGQLNVPASRNGVEYTVQLGNAPSGMLPQNERAVDLECQTGIRAALLAPATTGPPPTSLHLQVEVNPSRLLEQGYVTALVKTAALAEIKRLAASRPSTPAPVPNPPDPAHPIAEPAPVLAELAREVTATFAPPVEGALTMAVPDELERQHLRASLVPSLAAASSQVAAADMARKVEAARAAFRDRHSGHGTLVLDTIDRALERVTKGNPDLLYAYYDFYSDHKLTDDLVNPGSELGDSDLTFKRGMFTDLNRGMLHLEPLPKAPTDDPLSLLGGTLIHEYAHMSHLDNPLKGPTEGKAYGIEHFFAERMGDTRRVASIEVLGPQKGDATAYRTAYRVMGALYTVIDTGRPGSANLTGVSVARAREMAVEFIAKNESDFSDELRQFIAAEFHAPEGLGCLP